MTAQQFLAHQFTLMYDSAAANVDGMTQAHSLVQPAPEGNCANWILGHLVRVQNGVMQVLGIEPVWENEELDRRRFDPITEPADALDWDALRDRFLGSRERCLSAVSSLSEEALAEELPDPFGGVISRAGMLGVLAIHQAYHVGQLGLSRRLAGLEGAIRGPDQPES